MHAHRPALVLPHGVWCDDVVCSVCGEFLGLESADGAAVGWSEWCVCVAGGPRCPDCAPPGSATVGYARSFHIVPLAVARVRDAVARREPGPSLDCEGCGSILAETCYALNYEGYGSVRRQERSAGPDAYYRDFEGTVLCEDCACGEGEEEEETCISPRRVPLSPDWRDLA